MSNITFDLEGATAWGYGDETFSAGRHKVDADMDLTAAIAAGASAGVLAVVDGEFPAVEDDEVSLAKQEVALAARAELYAERDRALTVVAANDSDGLRTALEEWQRRMDDAAQEALEANP